MNEHRKKYKLENKNRMLQRILVLNAGSSSLKYALYTALDKQIQAVSASGIIEQIGQPNQKIKHKFQVGDTKEKINLPFSEKDLNYNGALKSCLNLLRETVPHDDGGHFIHGVGHRVVHGGETLSQPEIVNTSVIEAIKKASSLAPLHNPANLLGIETAMESLPTDCKHVAVFDTAFHSTLAPHVYHYAIPMEYYHNHGIRKYGFHGTSHEYILEESAKFLNKRVDTMNMISCHLGAGASVCCIKNGESIDVSMGLTPMEGLVMATRSGDIDPSALFHMMRELGMSKDEVEELIIKKSGWYGLSGEIDAREIERRADNGEDQFELTQKIMVHRIRKYIGAYMINLCGKMDALVFTAGLGENWPSLRELCLHNMERFGMELDKEKNKNMILPDRCNDVSTFFSQIRIFVIPTDEEKQIARQTVQLINQD
eukprot:TCONS_00015654-protein